MAALGIPSLMNNIQDKQFKTAAKKAYSKCSEVVALIKQEEGGSLDYYVQTTNSFKPVFMSYFKVLKDCGNHDLCVECLDESEVYYTLNGLKGNTKIGGEGQFITADGMFYNIQNSTSPSWTVTIIVDVNGYDKKPNKFGVDTFAFQIVNNNLLPMGSDKTYLKSSLYCDKNSDDGYQGLGCMQNVMQGIDY